MLISRKSLQVIIVFFLLLTIPMTVLLALSRQEIRKKAAEPQTSLSELKAEYAQGEVIVQFRKGVISKKSVMYKNIEQEPFTVKDIQGSKETEQVKKVLNNLKVEKIEKVFKEEITTGLNRTVKLSANTIQKLENYGLNNVYKLKFSTNTEVQQVIEVLSLNPLISYAEPNYLARAFFTPNDPYYLDSYPNNVINRDSSWNPRYDYLWGLKKINMEQAWDVSEDPNTIIVSVIDTGIDYTHPELGNCTLEDVNNNRCFKVMRGIDYINGDNDPKDDHGHGTHVAGTIAALTNNNIGISGISQNTRILPIKVLNNQGGGYFDQIAQAIIYAANENAKVINMSLGGESSETPLTLKNALDFAYDSGVTLVAAAGNDNDNVNNGWWPATYENAITVSASDNDDLKAYFSNYGDMIDVAAPGTETISLRAEGTDMYCLTGQCGNHILHDNYYRASGTSMSTPHVAALAAKILSNNPNLNPTSVRNIIANGAEKIGGEFFSEKFGFGRINAYRSLQEMDTQEPLTAKITYPKWHMIGKQTSLTITGFASGRQFDHYEIHWKKDIEGSPWSTENITLLNQGGAPVVDGNMATMSLTSPIFTDGKYILRLTVYDQSGFSTKTEVPFYSYKIIKSGWPVQLGKKFIVHSSPAIGDVDTSSPGEEIIISASENLGGNNYQGKTYVLSKDGNLLKSWTMSNGYGGLPAYYPSPVLFDADPAYPGLEILLVWWDTIYLWHSDGTNISYSWPKVFSEETATLSSASVGDIDGDNSSEIIAAFPNKVYALRLDGSVINGWPKEYNDSDDSFYIPTPTLGDVDQNYPGLEIAIGASNKVFLYHGNGSNVAGWPQNATKPPSYFGPITLTDIDPQNGNGIEILTATHNYNDRSGTVYVWNKNGVPFNSSWPKEIQKPSISGVSVSDIDSNASGLELIISSFDSSIYGFYKEGNPLNGNWPINWGPLLGTAEISDLYSSIPGKEIFAMQVFYGSRAPGLTIFSKQGEQLLQLPPGTLTGRGSPAIGLIDGKKAITAVSTLGMAIILEFESPVDLSGWPQYLHDERHTGAYIETAPTPTPTPTPTPIPSNSITITPSTTRDGRVIVSFFAYPPPAFSPQGHLVRFLSQPASSQIPPWNYWGPEHCNGSNILPTSQSAAQGKWLYCGTTLNNVNFQFAAPGDKKIWAIFRNDFQGKAAGYWGGTPNTWSSPIFTSASYIP